MLLLGAAVIGGVSGAIFLGRRQRVMSSAWLEVAGGPHAGHRIPLRQMPFRIGRALDNDWVLSDETVSRRHAIIYWSGREFFVRDLGSLGGTYINARPVVDSVLRPGDRLRIGTVDLVFMQGRPYPMNRF
jgi:pSer/pThr/pTyr-binding forkhead associated (FHA) protein